MKKIVARIVLMMLILVQVVIPVWQTQVHAIIYPLDGSFRQNLVQQKLPARAETKAVSVISFYAHIYTGQNSVSIDGFLFSFRGSNTPSVSSTGVYVQTYDTTNTSGITAAWQLIGALTTFTSPNSWIVYDLTRNSNNVYITARNAETLDGTGIPEVWPQMNFSSLSTLWYSVRAAQSEIVDFIPLNPRTDEVFSLTLSGQTYTATGTTVPEIISGILAAIVANPSPVGNCIDMTTYIRCTSIDSLTSLSASSSVTYPSPDTTAPISTLVWSGTLTLNVGDTYTELWATWIDNRDGTGSIISPYTGSVNTSQPGTYTLSYRYIDAGSNQSIDVTRAVTVIDVVPPVVTVLGSGSITHELDLPYVDSGATWTDDVDGSGSVTASGLSLMTATGVYTLTYTQTDAGWNVGTGSREVTLVDTISPVVNITTPSATVNTNTYKIDGSAPTATSVQISGGLSVVNITPVNGAFSVFVPLTQDATNTLTVTATDASNNSGTGQVAIIETSSGSLFSSAVTVSGATFSGATTFSGSSFNATTRVTVQAPVSFVSASGGMSVMPSGTIITGASGSVFDASAINALSVTVTGGLASNQIPNGALEFGVSATGLHFSRPIRIQIPVPGYSGTTIPVKVKHGGTTTFVTTGLTNNANSTCTNGVSNSPSDIATVTGSLATIYTCAASTFVGYTETATVVSGGGGGGGSYAPPIVISASPTSTPILVSPTTSGWLYTIVPVQSRLNSKRGFSIEVTPSAGSSFNRMTLVSVATTLPERSRVRITLIGKDGKTKITMNRTVVNGTVSWRTRIAGVYQIIRIGK